MSILLLMILLLFYVYNLLTCDMLVKLCMLMIVIFFSAVKKMENEMQLNLDFTNLSKWLSENKH